MTNETAIMLSDSDIALALALLFCLLLMGVGFKHKEFWLLAGPVWILSGVTVFIEYGVAFMLISVGVGMILMIQGALAVA